MSWVVETVRAAVWWLLWKILGDFVFTEEMTVAVVDRLVGFLEQLAANTGNVVDDRVVQEIKIFLTSPSVVAALTNFLNGLVKHGI